MQSQTVNPYDTYILIIYATISDDNDAIGMLYSNMGEVYTNYVAFH